MRRMLALCGSIGMLSVSAVGIAQQEKTCGDPSRRGEAIRLARLINSNQSTAFKTTGAYSRAQMDLTAPEGFVVKVINGDDRASYMVVIKDTQDPCGAIVFTDNDQVIYAAQPIQSAR